MSDNGKHNYGCFLLIEDCIQKKGLIRGPFGGSLKKDFFVQSGYSVYEQRNAIYNDFTKSRYFIDESLFKKLERFKVKKGDLIVSCSGTIGKIAEVPNNFNQGIINQALMIIRINEEKIDKSFFFQIFKSSSFQNRIIKSTQGGAMKNMIGISDFKKIKLLVPEKIEQQKIAQILLQWDEAIETTQSLIKQLKLRKKGLLQKCLSGKKRLAGFNEKWVQRKLSYYLKTSRDKNSNAVYNKNDVLSVSGEFGIVNQIKFQGRSFAGASVLNYGIVNNGDVVYTKSPLKANPYGIIKVNKGKAGIVSTLYAVYKCKETLDGTFIDYYFQLDDNLNRYLRPLVQKGTKNDMKINNEKVLIDPVCFPKLEEQRALSSFFMNIDNEIQTSINYLENLKMQKKGLMQQLLTGQKRLKID
ncbi:restriction endonuclease subunit S [Winogradskyella litorisediminis]|uniref:Restriction endonuclease subunit S n=1 Tax=Winogradskyella litorisediminis TaxID=1156618 RepID=A0ABW3N9Y4_9FLAO